MTAYAISGRLGVDFTKSYTAEDVAPVALGTEEMGSDGILYKMIRTTAAMAKGFIYEIDQSHTMTAIASVSSVSDAPVSLCIPQTAVSAPSTGYTYTYAWVGILGPMVFVGNVDLIAANVELYIGSAAGQAISSNIGGVSGLLQGLKFTTAPTVASTVAQGLATQRLGVVSI